MPGKRKTNEWKEHVETKRWSEILLSFGGQPLFLTPPSPPSFPYGNPCSSTELLGSSINQGLYEIPAGAKGQRRKLAAVFFLSFYVSHGANRQVRHQPHFHFKTNSPTGRGRAVCLLLHFMTHNPTGWWGGGVGWGGKRWGRHLPLLPLLRRSPIPSSSGAWGQTLEQVLPPLRMRSEQQQQQWLTTSPSPSLPKCCPSVMRRPPQWTLVTFYPSSLSLLFCQSTARPSVCIRSLCRKIEAVVHQWLTEGLFLFILVPLRCSG